MGHQRQNAPLRERGSGSARGSARPPKQAASAPEWLARLLRTGLRPLPAARQSPSLARGLLALQRSHGNATVQRLIQRQETETADPEVDIISGGNFSLLGEEGGLELDPELEAEMRAAQIAQDLLTPAYLRPNLFQLAEALDSGPDILEGERAPEPEPLVPAGRGPQRARTGKSSDLIKALLGVPVIDGAIDNLRSTMLDQVNRDVRSLSPGEAVAAITATAVVSGSALTAISLDPEARAATLGLLNGRVLPVPGIEGLGLELNTEGDNIGVYFHFDVGRFLPSLGFGPSSPSAIGAPPSPPSR